MKKMALALFVSLLPCVEALHAACKTETCREAVAWKNGYTAIVLDDDITGADYRAVLDAVEANGGAVAIETDRVFLGWVPVSAAVNLRATRGVQAVLHDAVTRPADFVRQGDALAALSFFNRVATGEHEDVVEAGLPAAGEPLAGCVVQRNGRSRHASTGADAHAARSGPLSSNFWSRTPYQNPDMRGRITVQLFRLDSNGALDPNLYTWTTADLRMASDQVWSAFTLWANEAAARNVPLSFRVKTVDPFSRYTRSFGPTPTRYEPITRPQREDYLWVNDALARHGFGASPLTNENVYTRNEEFNRYWRNDPTYGPFDRSFSVYIVYNPGSAPVTFADGSRAYAMYDGPFTMMMWNSGGWGPENLGRVLTHETGHIFWACDEYYDAPSDTGCFTCDHCLYNVGPRNATATPHIRNANCEYPATACDWPRTPCVMQDLSPGLCAHTPAQVGW